MKLRNYFFILMGAILFMACSTEQSGLTITGNVENAKDLTAYVDHKGLDNTIQSLGNTPVNSNGSFNINFPEGLETGIYRVRIGARSVDMVIKGNESKINIEGDINKFASFDYAITGSPMSAEYQSKIKDMIATRSTDAIKDYIKSDIDPLLALTLSLASSPANPANHATYTDISRKMTAAYPDKDITAQFGKFANTMANQFKMQQSKYKVQLGMPAPDIVMDDVNGRQRKLSDLRGNIVLLDFWASWCGPCRRANPHVVETYHKYKDQGFTVFSVSLDGLDTRSKGRYPADQLDTQMAKQKQRWLDAIAKDKLEWDYHVSDLKKWESAGVATYGVRSIPTTFLIDREGNIAALNPRNNLEEEIKKHI